jgi:CheY-like chemotaxis protein
MSEARPVVHIVDDDVSFLSAVARLLRVAGYTVQTFASAAEFLARLRDSAGCVVADLSRLVQATGLVGEQAPTFPKGQQSRGLAVARARAGADGRCVRDGFLSGAMSPLRRSVCAARTRGTTPTTL